MEQKYLQLLTLFLAETIATAMLVFLGCMGCVNLSSLGAPAPTFLTIVLGFGLAVMLIINIFGMISGAHLNPAVTLAAYVYKLVDIPTAIVYIIGQLIGGYLGYGLLRWITPIAQLGDNASSFCVSIPHVEDSKAFWVEFFITMALIMICCGVWDPRNAKHHDSVPLRFGLAVAGLALVGGPFSSGSMNPARSFGPALYNMNFKSHWIFWAAPLLSSLITSVAFRAVFYKEPPQELSSHEEVPLRESTKITNNV